MSTSEMCIFYKKNRQWLLCMLHTLHTLHTRFFILARLFEVFYFITILIIYMKKFLHFDWLRAVQFFFFKQCRKELIHAKRGNKPSILIGQWSEKVTDSQSYLLFSNQVHALDGAIIINGAIFPWLRDKDAFLLLNCSTISRFFHIYN